MFPTRRGAAGGATRRLFRLPSRERTMKSARIHRNRLTALLIATVIAAPSSITYAEEQRVKERSEIPQNYLWATETIYASYEDWETDYAAVENGLGELEALKGTLADGPQALLKAFKLREDITITLEKAFVFGNFRQALAFANQVGELAESQGHHPDIYLTWGKVKLTIWTHTIDGLTESDFILAAKIDALH